MTQHPEETTVLIADDEAGIRDLMTAWLEEEYEVIAAENGKAALDAMRDDVDVMLLDRRMPGQSGDEVLASIRADDYSIPVAMITAMSPDVDIVDMAFDDYVVKPVTKDEVRAVVKTLLKRATYDEKSRQFFRLASKKSKLEVSELVDHQEDDSYEQVIAEMGDLRNEIDSVLEELTTTDYQEVFKRI